MLALYRGTRRERERNKQKKKLIPLLYYTHSVLTSASEPFCLTHKTLYIYILPFLSLLLLIIANWELLLQPVIVLN
jgi:hypothetical protein